MGINPSQFFHGLGFPFGLLATLEQLKYFRLCERFCSISVINLGPASLGFFNSMIAGKNRRTKDTIVASAKTVIKVSIL